MVLTQPTEPQRSAPVLYTRTLNASLRLLGCNLGAEERLLDGTSALGSNTSEVTTVVTTGNLSMSGKFQ